MKTTKDNNKPIRISFDYDSTLELEIIQQIAKTFIKGGAEVFIITSRCNYATKPEMGSHLNYHKDLFTTAKKLGIPTCNIIFTNGNNKHKEYFKLNIDLHFDDMYDECNLINQKGGTAIMIPIERQYYSPYGN